MWFKEGDKVLVIGQTSTNSFVYNNQICEISSVEYTLISNQAFYILKEEIRDNCKKGIWKEEAYPIDMTELEKLIYNIRD